MASCENLIFYGFIIFSSANPRYNCTMKLSDLLDEHVITMNLRARDQKAALEEMAAMLKRAGKIPTRVLWFEALLEREAAGSTAVGKGIAFPHARIDGLSEPVAVLAISQERRPVPGRDNRPGLPVVPVPYSHREHRYPSPDPFQSCRTVFRYRASFRQDKPETAQAVLNLLLHHEKGGKETFFPLPHRGHLQGARARTSTGCPTRRRRGGWRGTGRTC